MICRQQNAANCEGFKKRKDAITILHSSDNKTHV